MGLWHDSRVFLLAKTFPNSGLCRPALFILRRNIPFNDPFTIHGAPINIFFWPAGGTGTRRCTSQSLCQLVPESLIEVKIRSSTMKPEFKGQALATMAQLVGHHPSHLKAAGSIPGQVIFPGCGLGRGCAEGSRLMFLSLTFSHSKSLIKKTKTMNSVGSVRMSKK